MGLISRPTERYFGRRVRPANARKGGELEKPWFMSEKFIEAAEIFITKRIKLSADAKIEEDDKLFPTIMRSEAEARK